MARDREDLHKSVGDQTLLDVNQIAEPRSSCAMSVSKRDVDPRRRQAAASSAERTLEL